MEQPRRIENIADLIRCAHEDPCYIIESGFYVIDKDKGRKPFILNDAQQRFRREMTTRDDILKAGQMGFSTLILAILTVKFMFVENAWCVSISHESEATKRLFNKVDDNLLHMEDWLKPFYIPGKRTAQGDITNAFANSKFYIGTAGARAFGRGDTIHYAHLSEISRWQGAGEVMTGIIRAVPLNDPNTWIVKETTANGEGNVHHTEYRKAERKESEFKAHFFPFFEYKGYRVPGAVIADHTEEEKKLLRRFPKEDEKKNNGYIDDEVLMWRRQMIASLNVEDGRPSEDMFRQEFPVDSKEAFLFSGNPIFPVEPLQEYYDAAPKPKYRGNLEGIPPNQVLDETDRGYLRIFELPKKGEQYIIFADTGQVHDRCSAHVVNKKTWRLAAVFHGQIQSNHFGRELNKLGHAYNKALIAVESNNMGQSTIDRLRELEYPNIYMREVLNEKTKRVTKEYGFYTTNKSKALIVGNMQDLLRTGEIPFLDLETADEMKTYVRLPDGSMGASEGNFDDRVISVCGVYYILKLHPFVEQSVSNHNNVKTAASRMRKLRTEKNIKKREK